MILASLIWFRDIICLHILLRRKNFLCSKLCKQIMSLDQMRDANDVFHVLHVNRSVNIFLLHRKRCAKSAYLKMVGTLGNFHCLNIWKICQELRKTFLSSDLEFAAFSPHQLVVIQLMKIVPTFRIPVSHPSILQLLPFLTP